ncbi:MAG: Xaa-Pro peptidase family protein, partial [Evtepia sp.]
MNKRIERVTKFMKEKNLSQIVVSAPASIYYLTGLWVEPHERLLALYLESNGRAVLFGNEIFGLSGSEALPIVTHKDGELATRDLATCVHSGKLGIDKVLPAGFLISLLQARPDVISVQGSAPIDLARRSKDEAERIAMRKSSQINDLVMKAAVSALHDGVRENELASMINRLYLEHGADCEGPQLVCFGANGADPHHNADSTLLKAGDSVTFDIFTPISHYWCDMTRTVFYKSVSEKQKEVYNLVRKANEVAESKIMPGVLLSELDKTAREIIKKGGYGNYFTHRLGHGCGLECHEPPDVGSHSDIVLEAGMVFSIEPGIYLPGEFGVRIEDLVLVTENGCEVLNAYPKDLQVI